MARPITPTQENVLDALRSLPARCRVNGVAGGTILERYAHVYDGRVLRALAVRRLISFTDRGIRIEE